MCGPDWAYLIDGTIKLKFSEFTNEGEFFWRAEQISASKTGFNCTGTVQLSPHAIYRYVHLQNTHKLCGSNFLCP